MIHNSDCIISSQKKKEKSDVTRIILVLIQLLIVAAVIVGIIIALNDVGLADDYIADVYAICQPGDYVNVRATPKKNGEVVGRFDCGDKFRTDWETQNGYLHVFVSLEVDEAWIHLGYVSAWEPEWKAGEKMTISAEAMIKGSSMTQMLRWAGSVASMYLLSTKTMPSTVAKAPPK